MHGETAISYWEEVKRKLVHLSSLWMVVFTLLFPERLVAAVIFGVLCLATLIVEHRYAAGKKDFLSRSYHFLFGRMLRKPPEKGAWIVSGGAPVLAAACIVNLLFPQIIAASALAVMLLGDAAAALFGRRFGKHKLVNGKSLEGSIAFLIFGIAGVSVIDLCTGSLFRMEMIVVSVFAGMLAELFQKQLWIDDNFSIPLAVGAVLYFWKGSVTQEGR